jgi:CBS-domain-containing membrane protein
MRRTVQDVMTRDVVAVRASTPFKELVRLLNEHRVTALPVLDEAGCVVVGVISESDLALREIQPLREGHTPIFESARHRSERTKAGGTTAAALMTTPAVTVGPQTPVAAAARLMHDRCVKHLPVVDPSGALDGIVARATCSRSSCGTTTTSASRSWTTWPASCLGCRPARSPSGFATASSAWPGRFPSAAPPSPWRS